MALFIPQVARGSHRINWETVEKCDFEAMLRNQDLETLESFLIILQKGRVAQKDYENPLLLIHVLKFVYLLQLALLYLEYTKQYQETTLSEIFLATYNEENQIETLERSLTKSKGAISKLRQQRQSAQTQVKQLKAAQRDVVYACLYCANKAFVSVPLLDAHYQRHHIDKFDIPKPNTQETLLTVQTILLQHQVNSMINAQTQQDFQMQTIQQLYFVQEQAEDSESSASEDLEDVGLDELRVHELQLQFERRQQELEAQLLALQNYMHIHQPKEIMHKISTLEDRLNNIKYIEPPPKEESVHTPKVSYNAGSLHDDISEIASDKDVYDVNDRAVAEEVQKSESVSIEKEPEIQIDNQLEAEYLYEERGFHHVVKLVKEKKVVLSKEEQETFRSLAFENELEKRMVKEIGVNLNEVYFKNQDELEEYLAKLQGLPYSKKKEGGGLFDQFKKPKQPADHSKSISKSRQSQEEADIDLDPITMKKTSSQAPQHAKLERVHSSKSLVMQKNPNQAPVAHSETNLSASPLMDPKLRKAISKVRFDDIEELDDNLTPKQSFVQHTEPSEAQKKPLERQASYTVKSSQIIKPASQTHIKDTEHDNYETPSLPNYIQHQKEQQHLQQQQKPAAQPSPRTQPLQKKESHGFDDSSDSAQIPSQKIQTIFSRVPERQGRQLTQTQKPQIRQQKFDFEEDDEQF